MFRAVLVPLDGSRFAEAALPAAGRLAKANGAKVHLVLVHQSITAYSGMGDLIVATPEFESGIQAQEMAYLVDTAAGFSSTNGLAVEIHQPHGIAGPEVCEAAARAGADLLVMATHGRGAFKRFWLGSVADYVVRHLAIPILLVQPGRGGESHTGPSFRRILVALDLSSEADAILEPAIALARATGAVLTLVHISEPVFAIGPPAMPNPVLPDAQWLEALRTAAQERLERDVTRLRGLGLKAEARVIVGSGAATGLLDLLEEDQFDLIAMTTHGRSGVRRLLLGSVADKVIRGAAKPVLLLCPPSGTL